MDILKAESWSREKQIWEDLPKKLSAENKDEDYFRKKSR